jgi:hypothetical protein
MRGAGIPEMDGETLANFWGEKLDQVQQGYMMIYLTNGRSAGKPFPATTDEAYTIAKDLKRSTAWAANGRGKIPNVHNFCWPMRCACTQLTPPPPFFTPGEKKKQPAAEMRVRNPRRPKTDAEIALREARQKAITCYMCDEPSHVIKNCPHQALATIEANSITRNEVDDAAAQAALYAAMYGADLAFVTADYAFFGPEEVLFDTAASKSVLFQEPKLPH